MLLLLAFISTAVGVLDAMQRSHDFQWSGERILLKHMDPWAVYLQGDPRHEFLLTQIPNYLPILYILIVPAGVLPFVYAKIFWALCNVGFAAGSAILAGRFFGLRGSRIAALVCLMLMATPTRTTIGDGQQGLLVLMVWCLALCSRRVGAGSHLAVGISYFKFSFAPALFLLLLLRRGWRAVLLSGVPSIVSAGLLWLWINPSVRCENFLGFVIEPFLVARTGFNIGIADPNLMNVIEKLSRGTAARGISAIAFAIALAVCALVSYLAFFRHAQSSRQWHLALMATMSYALFAHRPYDAVVLLFPLAYALRRWRIRESQASLALLAYIFFIERALQAVHLHPAWMRTPECLMLLGILALTYRLREESTEFVRRRTVSSEADRQVETAEGPSLAAA